MPRHLQNEIHSDFSPNSNDWTQYRTEIKTLFDASSSKDDFNDHLIREFNRKIKSLKLGENLTIAPYDAGFRFIGSSILPLGDVLLLNTTAEVSDINFGGSTLTKVGNDILVDSRSTLNFFEFNTNYHAMDLLDLSETLITSFGTAYQTIDSINVSGCTNLTTFSSNYTATTHLNASGCTNLTTLYCNNNSLTSLDLSANTDLSTLNCSYNSLTSLDLSANTDLSTLNCNYNSLTSLDLSANTSLSTFTCSYNALTSLDLSTNISLSTLNCYNNSLTSLDLSTNISLSALDCSYNALTETSVDDILITLNSFDNTYSGICVLEGGSNEAPSSNGLIAKTALEVRGWTVYTN